MSDRIVSQPSTAAYRENWERIWGNKPEPQRFMIGGIPFETDERVPMNEIWMRYSDGSIGPVITGIDPALPGSDMSVNWRYDGDSIQIIDTEREPNA